MGVQHTDCAHVPGTWNVECEGPKFIEFVKSNLMKLDSKINNVLDGIANELADSSYFNLQRRRYVWLAQQITSRVTQGAKIADVGASPGHVSLMLARLGYSVSAFDFDINSDMWETPGDSANFGQRLRDNNVEAFDWNLEVDDPRSVPPISQEGAFDAVVFTEVLEHIYRYPFASVRKVARLLKPGGLIFVTTPNRGYLVFRIKSLFGMAIDTSLEMLRDHMPPHMRHVWQYTLSEVESLLRQEGFLPVLSVVESFHLWTTTYSSRNCLDRWRPSSVKQILKLPMSVILSVLPRLGSTVCVIARKST